MKSIVWVSSWDRQCGIADYSKALFPAVQAGSAGTYELKLVSLDQFQDTRSLNAEISRIQPDLVHFQHEYGLYGGKNPPRYSFPKLIAGIRGVIPKAKLLATAHSVLPTDYRFPVEGRGYQGPLRWGANVFLLSLLRKYWGPKTWGVLDGVVVHSRLQVQTVQNAGAPAVEVIPHFVPNANEAARWKLRNDSESQGLSVLVFGFVTPEKGQDLAVSALSKTSENIKLILAGGMRREKDRSYYDGVIALIDKLELGSRVKISGFVPPERIDQYYREADLVLAPFRETSGSGSLAQALSRGAPVLASDLPLNREIVERVPGAITYFREGDTDDCARAIGHLLGDKQERILLSKAACEYADRFNPTKSAEAHLKLYGRILL